MVAHRTFVNVQVNLHLIGHHSGGKEVERDRTFDTVLIGHFRR